MENKYYLAIETKPKNYFPINLLDLKIANKYNTFSLEELDKFTLKFTKQEIINSIKEANLLDVTNNMPLVVIYYEKDMVRKIDALTKDINFDMWQNIKDNFDNKNYLNKIYNFLNNKISSEELLEIKACNDLKEFFNKISYLPYLVQRKLYLYLYEK
ncbi:MAG: hypothetical protein E7163_05230 [Firmicutes bacterium]|nr:hypothetical protein [Bacillota bacterium]